MPNERNYRQSYQNRKMVENDFPGPMTMIRIDGTKIKKLREAQGLTQLYLATAVEVTTDTISRWENRRYPTIKKENGMKLAQALNVELDELLESTSEEEPTTGEDTGDDPISPPVSPPSQLRPRTRKRIWPVLLLSATIAVVAAIFGWLLYFSASGPAFTATRIVPPNCIAGQPFPVLIRIEGEGSHSVAIIVKEQLPDDTTLIATFPSLTTGGLKNKELKWLKKINANAVFAYLVAPHGEPGSKISFHGTAAIGNGSSPRPPIGGDATTTISQFHWADTDQDNIISDSEILTVYDRYSDLTALNLELDQIEEIWLGSGYKWNPQTGSYNILE